MHDPLCDVDCFNQKPDALLASVVELVDKVVRHLKIFRGRLTFILSYIGVTEKNDVFFRALPKFSLKLKRVKFDKKGSWRKRAKNWGEGLPLSPF